MKMGNSVSLVGVPTPWAPTHFGQNLILRLDARFGASNDGSTFTWLGRSGTSATESTAGKLPTIVSDAGRPAISLAQNGGRAKITYATTLSQPCTIWTVVKTLSTVGGLTNIIWDGITAGNAARVQFVGIGTGGTSTLRMFAGSVLDSGTWTGAGSYHVFRHKLGATDTLNIDGSATAFVSGDSGSNSTTGMYLGADNTGSTTTTLQNGPQLYRSIHVVNRATTALEDRNMGQWLSRQWGIAIVP